MTTEKMASDIRKEQIVEAALHILSDNEVKKTENHRDSGTSGPGPVGALQAF